jgi:crossover junction endodeoxyribonuclease RusA
MGGAVVIVTLPWPHKDLSPNARVHFYTLAHQKKIARICAHYAAIAAGAKRRAFPERPAVTITFHPPKQGVVADDDNMKASFKAARDGIADAIGVDDGKWIVAYATGLRVKGGQVVVTVEQAAAE